VLINHFNTVAETLEEWDTRLSYFEARDHEEETILFFGEDEQLIADFEEAYAASKA